MTGEKCGRIGPGHLLLILLLLHAALHARYINDPPSGFHQWRQTQTLSVARNFYEEGMNILQPRVDSRGPHSGISGMEFPLVNYLIAVGYLIAGNHDAVHRVVMLLFGMVGIIGCHLAFKEIFRSPFLGLASAFLLVFSPLFFYYSFCALPDVPALSFLFLSMFYFASWHRTRQEWRLVPGIFLLCLAGLIKISAFFVFPALLYLLFYMPSGRSRRHIVYRAILVSVLVMIVLGWYAYATHLSRVHHNTDFKLESTFPYSISTALTSVKRVALQWLPEVYLNYAAFLLFLAGIVELCRGSTLGLWDSSNRRHRTVLALVTGGLVLFMITQLPMLKMHDYYMVVSLPLLVFPASAGLHSVVRRFSRGTGGRILIVSLLLLVAVLGSGRALSRFERATVPDRFLEIEEVLDNCTPEREDLVIAASNRSPSIYLYFMHRKGWPVTDAVTREKFAQMIEEGAKYLVSDSDNLNRREDLQGFLTPIVSRGGFEIFRLSVPGPADETWKRRR